MQNEIDSQKIISTSKRKRKLQLPWVWDVLLVGILVIGAFLRFTGIRWDGSYHLHPDERFLTMVESSITPVENLSQYFDTANSGLNPGNRGYTFYVYGTLPLFIVRYVGEWVHQTGYDQINVVGRVLSVVFDLGTLFFVYLIGKRLYRNSRLGLLAALFSALTVLQIQISHFFTVDNFANFFTYAAIYTAVCIFTGKQTQTLEEAPVERSGNLPIWLTTRWKSYIPYGAFGILYGMALASKVSIWALAAILPISALIYYVSLPQAQRSSAVPIILRNLVLGGLAAFITFRIFQPYAFMGPGFLGLRINPNWLASMRELSNLSKGDIDVPYALQWARRPVTFTLKNLVLWGLGIPLGVLSIGGLLWMSWRMVKGDWKKHAILWGWTSFVLITQSLNWVRSMRYILPIYPALAIIAAWTVFKLWESKPGRVPKLTSLHINWGKVLSIIAVVITVFCTGLWAFAFTSIYTRPVTRVAASEWIYENIPGAINFKLTSESGEEITQPAAYQNSALISADTPYVYGFFVNQPGLLKTISIEHVITQQVDPAVTSVIVTIREKGKLGDTYKAAGFFQSDFIAISDNNGEKVPISLQVPIQLERGKYYQLVIEVADPGIFLKISGAIVLEYQENLVTHTQYLPSPVFRLTQNSPYSLSFYPRESGALHGVQLNRVVDLLGLDVEKQLSVTLVGANQPDKIVAVGSMIDTFLPKNDPRGETRTFQFDKPIKVDKSTGYILQVSVKGEGELGIYNDVSVIESTWDDALPVGMFGYNQFGYWDGIYGNVRNLELYWDDTSTKLDLFKLTLDQSDAIFISSNRQWGTITRVPERYPLTIEYYRALIGCPKGEDILWCYSVAKPGMFKGELGFELTAVFQNDPAIGKFSINDQFAEEAFTVYDHPKVLIFQKTDAYSSAKMNEILGAVDLTNAVHKTPRQASKISGNLKLNPDEWAIQTAGGTWSELFPPSSILNKSPWLAAVIWYMAVFLLGLIVYPIIRYLLRGLADRGYAFSRLSGLLILAYITWLVGSLGGRFNRTTIGLVIVAMLVISAVFVYLQRAELVQELRTKKKTFLIIEAVILVFFLVDLGIRIMNPDLWHPWKGGEKPMDLSYFTAVLKSTTFPPYDPWFSGGYINYYYYGYVIVGVLVKFLGIVPNVAYNLILPTLFAFTGVGAFSIGWNLFALADTDLSTDVEAGKLGGGKRSFIAGISAAFAVLIAGNLGTLRMIWQGIQRLAAPDGVIDVGNVFQHLSWFVAGAGKFFTGTSLPYGFGDWYWNPSRAIPGDVITEFPFFTFTYADLHAHMIALPITLFVIGWVISVLLHKWNFKTSHSKSDLAALIGTIFLGGFIIGTLRPTNTWDFPTFLLLASLVVFYTSIKYAKLPNKWLVDSPDWVRRMVYSGVFVLLLVGFAIICYLPFTQKYGQAYGTIEAWKGEHTHLKDYLVHWGWQLFLIVSWFVWETREWLAGTPLSAVKKIRPYLSYIQMVGVLFLLAIVLLTALGIGIGWVVGLLGVWALILLLRPSQPDSKKMVLFMIGTGLLLTLFVELFALQGDIGRMNTVFKFYFQTWTFFGLSAAASLMWLIPAVTSRWKAGVANTWQVVFALLVFSAFLYPLTAASDKIRDRMSVEAPKGLDGIAFMRTARYFDQGIDMDLNQDYKAIQWMRNNVIGSPVIVETNTVEYRWGNRFTIYTGLPGVLGWNWHQRQQRGFLDYNGINDRLNEIPAFYQTMVIEDALSFLKKYNVRYIIVGQMEQAYYPGEGLLKFEAYDGVYWKEVFRTDGTVIYEVFE